MRHFSLVFSVVLAVLTIVSSTSLGFAQPCQTASVEYRTLSRRARLAANRGQMAEALQYTREMLILCPTDDRARYAAAYAEFRLFLWTAAGHDAVQCLRASDPAIANGCGQILWQITGGDDMSGTVDASIDAAESGRAGRPERPGLPARSRASR